MIPPWEALAMIPMDSRMQLMVTWSTVRAKKSEQLLTQGEGIVAGSLYLIPKTQWMSSVGKADKMEFSLVPPGMVIIQGTKQKASKAAEWIEPIEWKPPTMACSPSVEQLREKFGGMEMWGTAPVNSPT